jgi:hypothetical protein
MLTATTKIKNYKQSTLVTFTGFNRVTFIRFNSKNNLKKLGDINFWVNSSRYNQVENIHQYWLLLIVDLIAYSSKYK